MLKMESQRKVFLDALRVIACMAVVVFHVLGTCCSNDPQAAPNLCRTVNAFGETLRWHVPVFYIITGYLWLSREKDCTYRKMWPNIRRFLLVLFLFGSCYAFMERVFAERTIAPQMLIFAVFDIFTGNSWDHMWYIYSIIAVYLVLPVLKPFFSTAAKGSMWLFVVLLGVFSIVVPNIYTMIEIDNPIPFPFSETLFYVCVGGLIANIGVAKRNALPLLMIVAVCVFQFIAAQMPWYTEALAGILRSISAVCVFMLLKDRPVPHKLEKAVSSLSAASFGIYLIHPFFIHLSTKVLHIYPLRFLPLLSLALTSAAVIILSYFCSVVLRKISIVRKYIL